MNVYRFFRTNIDVIALVIVAAVLRLIGIGWGLPQLFEEATPMRQAWEMWGWGSGESFDLNPHFFNYPTLSIYIQFLAQGVMFVVMRIAGIVDSTLDYYAFYIADKTPFVVMGRVLTTAFGVATIWVMHRFGRHIAGRWIGAFAALLLAVNSFHIAKSQMIEVDVPLTFLVVLALWFVVRLVDTPTRRNYLLAGTCIGLAVSVKYPGVMLVVPLVVSHLFARRQANVSTEAPPLGWGKLLLAIGAILLAFFVTSPFTIFDAKTFLVQLSIERSHMQWGHFGLDESPTWLFYAGMIVKTLGWPGAVFSLAAALYLTFVRRHPWAVILTAFTVLYLVVVSTWSMRADRYALPVIPIGLLFIAGGLHAFVSRISRPFRAVVVAATVLICIVPILARLPEHFERMGPDARTQAKEWIEHNIPPYALLVSEAYGPQLFGPHVDWTLEPEVRERVRKRMSGANYYAVQQLPMYQTEPHYSSVFYDMRVLDVADVIITTGAVRSRYEKNPAKFTKQLAFYNELETRFEKMHEFVSRGRSGSTLSIYHNPRHRKVFGKRNPEAPPPLEAGMETSLGSQERFYFNFGLAYEAFGFYPAAFSCYEMAFRYSVPYPVIIGDVAAGLARCLVALERHEDALNLLRRIEQTASDGEKRQLRRMIERIQSGRL